MRHCQFRLDLFPNVFRQLLEQVFAKIETDSDAVDANQADHVFDVINIAVDRRVFGGRADENRVYSDNAGALPDRFDLVVANVALDVVKFSRVGMRNNQRLLGKIDNLVKTFRIDVRQIDNNAEPLAFLDQLASESGESIARGTARREDSAAAGRVASCVRESDHSHTELVKDAQ